ncbi:hypothetical protein NUM3379_33850 [Kineococcus sp. NUM-3379]
MSRAARGTAAPRRRPPEPTGSGRGWKEQLRRVSELCLLGLVAALLCAPVLTAGAVVAALSGAVGHWCEEDELPPWSRTGSVFVRRLLPGAVVSAVGVLAVLVVAAEHRWLRAGTVPGGEVAAGALLVAVTCLAAVVLLAVPRLADGRSWRSALAAGWQALLRVPAAGAAVVVVTGIAVLLAVLLPGVVLVLPALWVLGLHAVDRVLVRPRLAVALPAA